MSEIDKLDNMLMKVQVKIKMKFLLAEIVMTMISMSENGEAPSKELLMEYNQRVDEFMEDL